jgi:hypothetical protein
LAAAKRALVASQSVKNPEKTLLKENPASIS